MTESLLPEQAEQLRRLIVTGGLDVTSSWLQLNPTTLLRAAVGLGIHTATRLVIQQKLSEHAKENTRA